MSHPLHHQAHFPGTFEGAAEASVWLRAVAEGAHLPDRVAFALEVCLEELVTNVVRHGRGAGDVTAHPLTVGIALELGPDAVDLVIEDNGTPFDVSQAPGNPIRRPLEDVVPGGLGMQLIRSFSNGLHYEAIPDGNRIIVNVLRQPEVAPKAEL